QLATVRFRAVDARGKPIAGATVSVGGEEVGQTGPNGTLTLADQIPGSAEISATSPAPFYTAPAAASVELTEGEQSRTLTFGDVPRAVNFEATTPEGTPLAATVA